MSSKFKELMDQARICREDLPQEEREAAPESEPQQAAAPTAAGEKAMAVSKGGIQKPPGFPVEAQKQPESAAKRRGRPRGKRSHPDFEQVSAYISRRTHLSVKIALLQEGQGREFSELVEELLSQWLQAGDSQ